MASLYDIVTAPEIAAYWNINAKYEEPYFGESKFPNRKKRGLDLSWIKGARKAPVSLSLSAFDADVLPLKRGEVSKLSTEMPFFKNEYRIDEKLRQELLILLQANNPAVSTVVGQIFDDESSLMRNAALTREMLRMQLLTTGVIALSDNGQEFSYDFGLPASHKVTPDVKWDVHATADPIADILKWQRKIQQEKGIKPTEILMNSDTLLEIGQCEKVQKGVAAMMGAMIATEPSDDELIAYMEKRLKSVIYAYDKGYDNNGTFKKFVPDGTVVLMPNTALGNTWFGTTPEEADLTSGTDAQVSIVDTGVAIATWKEKDPVTVRTKGSQVVLPSFELADEVIIASVLTAA